MNNYKYVYICILQEGNIDARRPGLTLLQISRIIKERDEITGGMYMLVFKIASDVRQCYW